jgi:hypothetical protein
MKTTPTKISREIYRSFDPFHKAACDYLSEKGEVQIVDDGKERAQG